MKSVLLTGCSKGIGNAILKKMLLMSKYKVYAITQNVQDMALSLGERLQVYGCDLTHIDQVQKMMNEVLEDSQGIDILINNAGLGKFALVENIDISDWNRLMTINLTIPFMLTKHFLPNMRKNNYGRIINVTSDADHIGFAEGSLYCATKFGLRGFSDSVRKEVKGLNISVTTIGPARVDTFFNDKKPGDRPISLSADDVANQVIHVMNQSDRCEIERIYLKSTLE